MCLVAKTIVDILMAKLKKAAKQTGIKQIAIGGGVSANSGLQKPCMMKEPALVGRFSYPDWDSR